MSRGEPRGLWWYIATWFGVGTVKYMSGTVGSLAALPFAYYIHITYGNYQLFLASLALFWIGGWATKHFLFHNRDKGTDPKQVVVDEVAGQWLILSVLYPTWQSYLVGFILFRIFDILKPWPVNVADRKLKGALGVMFDDFLAAMYPVLIYLIVMLEVYTLGANNPLLPTINFLSGDQYFHAH